MREEKDVQSTLQMKTINGYEKSRCNDDSTVPNNISSQDDTEQPSDFSIVISNVTAKWTDTQTDNTIENINLTVKSGNLIAIIGPVGAGKV